MRIDSKKKNLNINFDNFMPIEFSCSCGKTISTSEIINYSITAAAVAVKLFPRLKF